MILRCFLKKGISLILFFLSCLLYSCSLTSGPQWEIEGIPASRSSCESAKLYYPIQNTFSGIELSFISGSYGVRGYLDVQSIPLTCKTNSDDKIEILVRIQNTAFFSEGTLFQGGQRILLDDICTAKMIEALLDEQEVFVQVGRYETTFLPTHFASCYGIFYAKGLGNGN